MLLNLCTRLRRSPAISPLGHCIFLPQVGSIMDWAVEVEAIWASFDIYLSPWQNASAPRTKEMTHEWNLDFPNAINSIAVPYCVTKKLCFKMQSLAEFKGKRHENNSWSIAHRWRSETDHGAVNTTDMPWPLCPWSNGSTSKDSKVQGTVAWLETSPQCNESDIERWKGLKRMNVWSFNPLLHVVGS